MVERAKDGRRSNVMARTEIPTAETLVVARSSRSLTGSEEAEVQSPGPGDRKWGEWSLAGRGMRQGWLTRTRDDDGPNPCREGPCECDL